MKQNLHERNHLGKNQPNINHFHIGSGREALRDTNKEGCKDKKRGKINCHNSLKKEILEEVCWIDNDEDKDGWKVSGEDGIINSSLECNYDMNSIFNITCSNQWLENKQEELTYS